MLRAFKTAYASMSYNPIQKGICPFGTLLVSKSTVIVFGYMLRPNKKIIVFWVTGLKLLGRVGTHIFFNYFFS